MDMWTPRDDEPLLLDWWGPLIEFARNLRLERFSWPAHVDEFELVGRVDRRGKPAIWVYRHLVSRGFVHVDEEGNPYRFIAYSKGPSLGRFAACDLRRAAWMAGLPDVVEPIKWCRPPGDVGVGRAVFGSDPAAWDDDPPVRSGDDPYGARDGSGMAHPAGGPHVSGGGNGMGHAAGGPHDQGDDDGDGDGPGGDGPDAPDAPDDLRGPRRPVVRGHLRLVHDADDDAASRPA